MTARAKRARLNVDIFADRLLLARKGETVTVVGERELNIEPTYEERYILWRGRVVPPSDDPSRYEVLIKLPVNLLAINAMWVNRSNIIPIGRGTRARVTRPSSVPARKRRKR